MEEVNISNALKIEGFMDGLELIWLAQRAKEYKFIIEVGSLVGRSTRALGDNINGVVWTIDDWHGPREAPIFDDSNILYNIFKTNLQKFISYTKNLLHAKYT